MFFKDLAFLVSDILFTFQTSKLPLKDKKTTREKTANDSKTKE